jgi:GT2 family glycosyltransferase
MDQRVIRAGYQITYNPQALVFHHRPENIQQWRKVMHAYGRAQGKMMRESGPRRKPQYLALTLFVFLGFLGSALIRFFEFNGLLGFLAFLGAIFFLRPDLENSLGIRLSALQWLNGFIEGFVKNRSDPPGYRSQPLSERLAKLRKDKDSGEP